MDNNIQRRTYNDISSIISDDVDDFYRIEDTVSEPNRVIVDGADSGLTVDVLLQGHGDRTGVGRHCVLYTVSTVCPSPPSASHVQSPLGIICRLKLYAYI
jgi:hypothetical protein